MRHILWSIHILAIFLSSFACAILAEDAPTILKNELEASEEAQIALEIQKLSDNSFPVREKAQQNLITIGLRAEKLLLQASNSPDAEVAQRIKLILAEIELLKIAPRVEKLTFEDILERVHIAAENTDWHKHGWSDILIEKGIERLVEQVKLATKRTDFQVPVRFATIGIDAGKEPGFRGFASKLYVLKNGEIPFATNSIILADGNVHVSHAQECIIIARGVVEIGHGNSNIVLAGHYVSASHDGEHDETKSGSLLMSGSILNVAHSHGSILYASTSIDVSHAHGTTFFNSPKVRVSRKENTSSIANANVSLLPKEPTNKLKDKLKITQLVRPGSSTKGAMAVIDQNGVEVAIRPGNKVTDNLGNELPELTGWRLSFVAEDYAIFSNGNELSGFYIP